MLHASFTKKQYALAKARHETVRLISVTVRDPITSDIMTVSLVTDLSTANDLMNFMLGAATSKEASVRAVVTEVP